MRECLDRLRKNFHMRPLADIFRAVFNQDTITVEKYSAKHGTIILFEMHVKTYAGKMYPLIINDWFKRPVNRMYNLQDARLILASACFCFIGIFLPDSFMTKIVGNIGVAEHANK